jgi:succinyl-CoA synthetase alpha subunit
MIRKFSAVLSASVCALALSACSAEKAASTSLVGMTADNFQLTDQDGVAQTLRYDKQAKAVVLVAQTNGDEASRAAGKALEALKAKHPGVAIMMVNSSDKDDRASIAAEVKAQGYTFPVLDDDMQLVGPALVWAKSDPSASTLDRHGFSYTGEAVVIDPKTWRVVYNGPVEGKTGGVDAALAELTTGKPVTVAYAAGKGTQIAYAEKPNDPAHANLTYVKDVAPILEKNCAACHAPGGIAPWAMTSYEVVKGFSPMIREAIRTDRMPPYNADRHVGQFQEYANLSEADTKTLIHWIDAGAPRGEGEDPLTKDVKALPEWSMGKPDLVVDIPAYTVPASGVVDYQMPAVANPLKEGRWLKSTAFKAGSRQGVHHILAGWIPKLPKDAKGGFDWNISMGGYAVGRETNTAPADWGTWVPPGGAVSFQMHYTPYGKEYTDASKVGFYFLDKAPEKVMRQIVAVDPSIEIAPGEARHHERAYVRFPAAVQIYGAQPHAHYRGYSSKLTAIYPDGRQEVVLNLPKYDFGYQQEYVFQDLIELPAGSILVADYLYDNSPNNPANPDPTKMITWGDQSFQEMLFTAIRFRWTDETSTNRRDDLQKQLESQTLFTAIDDNIDGKWQEAELRLNASEGIGDMMKAIKSNFAQFDGDKDGALSPEEVGGAMQAMQKAREAEIAKHRGRTPAAGGAN